MIVFYPGNKEKGGIRNQYGHVIDLLPTTTEFRGFSHLQKFAVSGKVRYRELHSYILLMMQKLFQTYQPVLLYFWGNNL
jgi:hypothetical protein